MSLFPNLPMLSRRQALKSIPAGLAGIAVFKAGAAKAALPENWESISETRLLMGTFVSINLAGAPVEDMRHGLDAAFTRIEALSALFDRHDATSPVGVLNAQGSLKDAPLQLIGLLESSRLFGRLTGQAFDITVQPVLDLFRKYGNPGGNVSIPRAELQEAQALMGHGGILVSGRNIRLDRQGMGLTFDGIAKGHIADEASLLLAGLGLNNHLINAGGDIVAKGIKKEDKAWMSAISNPLSPARHGRPFALHDAALATSGSYRAFYDSEHKYHHLINPATGVSSDGTLSVSVLGKNAMEADALATGLSIMPARAAIELVEALPGRECLVITTQGRYLKSSGWPVA